MARFLPQGPGQVRQFALALLFVGAFVALSTTYALRELEMIPAIILLAGVAIGILAMLVSAVLLLLTEFG